MPQGYRPSALLGKPAVAPGETPSIPICEPVTLARSASEGFVFVSFPRLRFGLVSELQKKLLETRPAFRLGSRTVASARKVRIGAPQMCVRGTRLVTIPHPPVPYQPLPGPLKTSMLLCCILDGVMDRRRLTRRAFVPWESGSEFRQPQPSGHGSRRIFSAPG